eukprot:9471-Heterococcus_DN1.PRE.2
MIGTAQPELLIGAELQSGDLKSSLVVYRGFVAGLAAGLSECVSSFPLDTIKTRMQTSTAWTSSWDCLSRTVREEGAMTLYQGMSSAESDAALRLLALCHYSRMVSNMIQGGLMFGCNGGLKKALHANSEEPASPRFLAAAALTGSVEFGNMVFFGSYEYFKRSLPKLRAQLQQRQQHSAASSSAAIAAQPDHASIALAGGLAGMSFWGSVHPIDLVKSLIQTDNLRNPRFSGMADCFRQVVAERGLTGMYRSVLATHTIMATVDVTDTVLHACLCNVSTHHRGLGPSLARAFVGNACQFTVYENVMRALQ